MSSNTINPLVSVIIPVYNRAELILETINSVLNQTYQDFEIIIIDDGSVDNTKQVIESIKDSRIKYIYQENAGTSAARNNGTKNAKGEWIAPLDSDDIWLPEKLEKQINFLKNNPDIDICNTWVEAFSKNTTKKWTNINDSESIATGLLFDSTLFHSASLIRKELFDKYNINYNVNYKSSLDYDLWVKFAQVSAKFYVIPEILVRYRIHENQISTNQKNDQIKNAAKIRITLLNKLGITPTDEEIELHESIGYLKPQNNFNFYKKVNNWFKKIINANKKSKIYSQSSLDYIIANYWITFCILSKKDLLILFYFFIITPLSFKIKINAFLNRLVIFFKKRRMLSK